MFRVGIGYDLHKLVYGRKLIIGGIKIDDKFGCEAHSDGDILIHSIVDSFLSSLNIGDIGTLYPDDDLKYKDISSIKLLEDVYQRFLKNIKIINIDSVIILDKPKLQPYILDIKSNISKVLNINVDQIGVKAKTSENTRIYSIECYSVVLYEI